VHRLQSGVPAELGGDDEIGVAAHERCGERVPEDVGGYMCSSTPGELRVAGLTDQDVTNRDMARRCSSPSAASKLHLNRVYRKLEHDRQEFVEPHWAKD
jgi:hypothetical protein